MNIIHVNDTGDYDDPFDNNDTGNDHRYDLDTYTDDNYDTNDIDDNENVDRHHIDTDNDDC